MPLKAYWASVRIGGGTGAGDKIPGADLNDKDMQALLESTDTARFYWLDDDASGTEGEGVTNPDTNPGTKSWLLLGITLPNTGLHLLDTDASHDLIIKPGSDLSADRTVTLTTGDASRTITLSGNPTLDDWFDQAVKQASSPSFAGFTKIGDASNYMTVAADGEITLAGTARVKKEIIIGAGDFHKGVAAPDDVYLTGGVHVLAFDKSTTEHGHYDIIIPQDFAAGTTIAIEVDWSFDISEADHYMTWELEYLLLADGEDPAGAMTSTYQKSVISTDNHDKQIHTTFGTGITGAVADETLFIRFSRDSDASKDTDDLDQDARLHVVHLHYIADKLGEAT